MRIDRTPVLNFRLSFNLGLLSVLPSRCPRSNRERFRGEAESSERDRAGYMSRAKMAWLHSSIDSAFRSLELH